jgi:hypothetical protein
MVWLSKELKVVADVTILERARLLRGVVIDKVIYVFIQQEHVYTTRTKDFLMN